MYYNYNQKNKRCNSKINQPLIKPLNIQQKLAQKVCVSKYQTQLEKVSNKDCFTNPSFKRFLILTKHKIKDKKSYTIRTYKRTSCSF